MIRKCNIKKCIEEVIARGLCTYHYSAAKNMVKNGSITWEKLMKAGICVEGTWKHSGNKYTKDIQEILGLP